jgi:hypothetical protein
MKVYNFNFKYASIRRIFSPRQFQSRKEKKKKKKMKTSKDSAQTLTTPTTGGTWIILYIQNKIF